MTCLCCRFFFPNRLAQVLTARSISRASSSLDRSGSRLFFFHLVLHLFLPPSTISKFEGGPCRPPPPAPSPCRMFLPGSIDLPSRIIGWRAWRTNSTTPITTEPGPTLFWRSKRTYNTISMLPESINPYSLATPYCDNSSKPFGGGATIPAPSMYIDVHRGSPPQKTENETILDRSRQRAYGAVAPVGHSLGAVRSSGVHFLVVCPQQEGYSSMSSTASPNKTPSWSLRMLKVYINALLVPHTSPRENVDRNMPPSIITLATFFSRCRLVNSQDNVLSASSDGLVDDLITKRKGDFFFRRNYDGK
jgi:hypothetical protein